VWILLHNSETSTNETASVRLYLDESGGKDPNTPKAVVGGLLINYSHFLHFEDEWDHLLDTHGITAPLHMREFGKDGKLGGISICCRREIFTEVAQLINSHKIGSQSSTLTNSEYESLIPKEARDIFSPYAMCYNLAIMTNHKLAEGVYEKKIPVILDMGNPYADHVRKAHAAALTMQNSGEMYLHLGGLYFDDDAEFGVLQAADVIAWSIRRLASGLQFPPGMEAIREVLAYKNDHRENKWKTEWLKEMGDNIGKRVEEMKRIAEAERRAEEYDEEF
jgi:hypothetical protein